MKKAVEAKYPHSSNLFQFCRMVLDQKFGGIRVIDQDVGQILGFDPADCSHWKKGKKNIRSIQAMKSIADHLGVDERLVVDVASGELDENEAYFEFNGYGAFEIDSKILESAKKDFYRRNAGSWTREREAEFRTMFDANEPAIDAIVLDIHQKINLTEAPLYLPELAAAYPEIRFTAVDDFAATPGRPPIAATAQEEGVTITYKTGSEMRPFVRYAMAKSLAPHFFKKAALTPSKNLGEHAEHIAEVQGNLFAGKLLVPTHLVRKEINAVQVNHDIVAQLAETFWVSKSLMNRRLKDIVEKLVLPV